MTDEQLAAIRARCEAAIPGPWRVTGYMDSAQIETGSEFDPFRKRGRLIIRATGIASPYTIGQDNAKFIAHAREDVPALLAEVERLRGLLSSGAAS